MDDKVREHLVLQDSGNKWKVEPLSWYGYGQFRRFIEPNDMACQNIALVFFQKNQFEDLTDINSVFKGLNQFIDCGKCKWIVSIVGLLKGNIDGFVLLIHEGTAADLSGYAENYRTWLSQVRHKDAFWGKTSPVVVYYGERYGY